MKAIQVNSEAATSSDRNGFFSSTKWNASRMRGLTAARLPVAIFVRSALELGRTPLPVQLQMLDEVVGYHLPQIAQRDQIVHALLVTLRRAGPLRTRVRILAARAQQIPDVLRREAVDAHVVQIHIDQRHVVDDPGGVHLLVQVGRVVDAGHLLDEELQPRARVELDRTDQELAQRPQQYLLAVLPEVEQRLGRTGGRCSRTTARFRTATVEAGVQLARHVRQPAQQDVRDQLQQHLARQHAHDQVPVRDAYDVAIDTREATTVRARRGRQPGRKRGGVRSARGGRRRHRSTTLQRIQQERVRAVFLRYDRRTSHAERIALAIHQEHLLRERMDALQLVRCAVAPGRHLHVRAIPVEAVRVAVEREDELLERCHRDRARPVDGGRDDDPLLLVERVAGGEDDVLHAGHPDAGNRFLRLGRTLDQHQEQLLQRQHGGTGKTSCRLARSCRMMLLVLVLVLVLVLLLLLLLFLVLLFSTMPAVLDAASRARLAPDHDPIAQRLECLRLGEKVHHQVGGHAAAVLEVLLDQHPVLLRLVDVAQPVLDHRYQQVVDAVEAKLDARARHQRPEQLEDRLQDRRLVRDRAHDQRVGQPVQQQEPHLQHAARPVQLVQLPDRLLVDVQRPVADHALLVRALQSCPKNVKFSIEFGMFASMMCVYVMPLILYVECRFGHWGMLYMKSRMDAQRSRNLSASYRKSPERIASGERSASGVAAATEYEWSAATVGPLPEISRYDSRHRMQSRPAFANTSMLSVSRNTRKMSIMFDRCTGRLRAVRSVPNSGLHPDRISVRCASTISYRQATIWSCTSMSHVSMLSRFSNGLSSASLKWKCGSSVCSTNSAVRPGDCPHLQHVQQRARPAEHLQRDVPDAVQQQRQRQRIVLHLPRPPEPPRLLALLDRGAAAVELLARRPAQALEELLQGGQTEPLGRLGEQHVRLVRQGAQHLGGVGLRQVHRIVPGVRLQDRDDVDVGVRVRCLQEAVHVHAGRKTDEVSFRSSLTITYHVSSSSTEYGERWRSDWPSPFPAASDDERDASLHTPDDAFPTFAFALFCELNRSCSSWVTCRQTENTGSQQSALCEPSSSPPESTTSIESAWLAGIFGPAFWHTFDAIRLMIFPARCCRLSALLSVAAACNPSRLSAYSVSPEPRDSFRTRSVFLESLTSRAVGEPPASPSPAVSTATIESQQQVSRRRAILRAARCFAVGSLCTRTTDCSRCQSESICVGPVPPASCSMSSRAQCAEVAGSPAILRWLRPSNALVELAEPGRRQVHQYAGVLHRRDELLLGKRNRRRFLPFTIVIVMAAAHELQCQEQGRIPSALSAVSAPYPPPSAVSTVRVAPLFRWQTRDANSCTASSISIDVFSRSKAGTSSPASTPAKSRACCRSQSPSERPSPPPPPAPPPTADSSMCAHSQLPWLAFDDTSSPDECVSSSGPSVSPDPTEPSSGSIPPCSSGPSASDSDDDSNPLWRSSATASRYGGGSRVIDCVPYRSLTASAIRSPISDSSKLPADSTCRLSSSATTHSTLELSAPYTEALP
uniref:Uncharacterized protein n=1 Tax=Anopheles farauti TaxID=69004 RepID=A0A182Q8H9_9DIPT